jgi:hypothetical protein
MAACKLCLDIWTFVAEALRGDTAALRACALVSSATCGSMQRELFRTVSLPYKSFKHTTRLVNRLALVLSARPALASYIRRVEDHAHAARSALAALARFARSGRTGSASFFASLQELAVGSLSDCDEGLLRGLSAYIPSVRVLELETWPTVLLMCIPTVFPALQTLRLHDISGPRNDIAKMDPGVPRLKLKAFTYTSRSKPTTGYQFTWPLRPDAGGGLSRTLVERGLSWTHVERVGIDATLAPRLWPALCNAGTRLRHLFIHCVGTRDINSLHALIPSPGTWCPGLRAHTLS